LFRKFALAWCTSPGSTIAFSDGMTQAGERGFSIIEATIAVSLLAIGVAALAQLTIASAQANMAARRATIAQQAAIERMEQLRALAWTSDGGVVPVTDWSSDLTTTPASGGGSGLATAPATLATNASGYCDFLDADGRWLAGGTRAPAGAAWVRRWSVTAVDSLADTLVLRVVVIPASASRAGLAAASTTNGAWLVAMRTRRAR
jgi:Tfp pilus assembly protein PilV